MESTQFAQLLIDISAIAKDAQLRANEYKTLYSDQLMIVESLKKERETAYKQLEELTKLQTLNAKRGAGQKRKQGRK